MLLEVLLNFEQRYQQRKVKHGPADRLEVRGTVQRLIPPAIYEIEWILSCVKQRDVCPEAIQQRLESHRRVVQ
jgi:hypothetical protein